ncbi:MAG: SBBP repeat-containing protein [Candidatus Thorarchaeota archaeon]
MSPQFWEEYTSKMDLLKTDNTLLTSSTSFNYKLVWERIWPMNPETQGANEIAIDSNDNIYQVGYSILEQWKPNIGTISEVEVLLIKSNKSSDVLWSRTWGYDESEYGRDVAVDSNDNIYVCGLSTNFETGYRDMFIVKFDSLGNELWNQTWGKLDFASGEAIAIDSEDNIYFVGQGNNEGSTTGIILIKYNSSGSILWERIWDSYRYEWAEDVCVDSQDNIYITGHKNYDILLIKYDSNGTGIWSKTCSQGDYAYGLAVDSDSDNNIYIGGVIDNYYSGDVKSNLILMKYNSSGHQLWNVTCNEGDETVCYDLVIDSNGFVFLSGNLMEGDVQEYVYVSIYDWQGNLLWNVTWGDSILSYGFGINVDSKGNIYVSGYTIIHQGVYDETLLLKYSKKETSKIPFIPGYNQLFLIGLFFFSLIYVIKKKIINPK